MNCLYPIADAKVAIFIGKLIDERMYVLSSGNKALIIDPNTSPEAMQYLQELQPEDCLILITHEHYDHIYGVNLLRQHFNCHLICSKICSERIINPRKNVAAHFSIQFLFLGEREKKRLYDEVDQSYWCEADEVFEDSYCFTWAGIPVHIQEVPGHSPGSQIIRIGDNAVFTGDTLVPGEETITRLPGGSRRAFNEVAVPYFNELHADAIIFPGHKDPVPFGSPLAQYGINKS